MELTDLIIPKPSINLPMSCLDEYCSSPVRFRPDHGFMPDMIVEEQPTICAISMSFSRPGMGIPSRFGFFVNSGTRFATGDLWDLVHAL
jgi:hypothetical protein